MQSVSFYRAANAIFGKTGRLASEVTLQLIVSKCMPILLYGLEACTLNQSQLSSLDFYRKKIFVVLLYTLYSSFFIPSVGESEETCSYIGFFSVCFTQFTTAILITLPYYAALLPRRGPHIVSHSVCLSVRPSRASRSGASLGAT